MPPNEQVRSMCGVLLRKTVMQQVPREGNKSVALVTTLAPQVQQQMKQELLECIKMEPQRNIRKKVCDAVG